MTLRVRELWPHLNLVGDERAALSVVFERRGGDYLLSFGSLIFGPPPMSHQSWPAWRLAEGHAPTPQEASLRAPATFFYEADAFAAGRASLSQDEAREWATSALDHGIAPAVGPLPRAAVSLAATRAPIRVSTQSETPAGNLATWLARPVQGFHFNQAIEVAVLDPEEPWTVNGDTFYMPSADLLGLSWFEGRTGRQPSGLLLGRLERRAWLAGQHLRPEDDLYDVEIGFEPARVALSDLELEVEERVDDELVLSETLRCEDLDVLDGERQAHDHPGPGKPKFVIRLPTLGRKVRRAVRLRHRDGSLLVRSGHNSLVGGSSMSLNSFDGRWRLSTTGAWWAWTSRTWSRPGKGSRGSST